MTDYDTFVAIAGTDAGARLSARYAGKRFTVPARPTPSLVEICGGEDLAGKVCEAMAADDKRRFIVPASNPDEALAAAYEQILLLRRHGAEAHQIAERVGLGIRQVERVLLMGRRAFEDGAQ